jgi:hypothetical protein
LLLHLMCVRASALLILADADLIVVGKKHSRLLLS